MTKRHQQRRKPIPPPRTLTLPPDDQPSKAELEEEFDMPGLTLDRVRVRLIRPFRFVRKES